MEEGPAFGGWIVLLMYVAITDTGWNWRLLWRMVMMCTEVGKIEWNDDHHGNHGIE